MNEITASPHQIVVIAVEGLEGSTATSRFMPLVQTFVAKGAWTPMMRTIHPAPKIGWASIFFSLGIDRFGCSEEWCGMISQVTANVRSWVDILEEDLGYSVTLLSENKKMMAEVLQRPVTRFSYTKEGSFDSVHLPITDQPRLVLLHYTGLNRIGESSGYDLTNYRAKVDCLDKSIYKATMELWEFSPDNTTFILVSNHGGSKFVSTKFNLESIQVPFMLWGHNVTIRAHFSGQESETLQVGPTLFDILGYNEFAPEEWIERPISGINTHGPYPNRTIFLEHEEIKLNGDECQIPMSVTHRDIVKGRSTIIIVGLLVHGLIFFLMGKINVSILYVLFLLTFWLDHVLRSLILGFSGDVRFGEDNKVFR